MIEITRPYGENIWSVDTGILPGLVLFFVILAKAGIQNRRCPGFRIKCGMTTHVSGVDGLIVDLAVRYIKQ